MKPIHKNPHNSTVFVTANNIIENTIITNLKEEENIIKIVYTVRFIVQPHSNATSLIYPPAPYAEYVYHKLS